MHNAHPLFTLSQLHALEGEMMKTSLPRLLILCFVLFSQLTACQQWNDKMCAWFDQECEAPLPPPGVSSSARSCEVLVDNLSDSMQVDTIEFTDAVEGFSLNRGSKVAIAFVSKNDQAIPVDAVKVTMKTGESRELTRHINETASACFDSNGTQLTDKFWSFQ